MITLKINLLQLKCSVVKMKAVSGMMDCLVIPIEKNSLYVGEKGIYLDMVAFELKTQKEGSKDTHLIKQSLPKEIREQMSEEEQKGQPILGNMALGVTGLSTNTVSSSAAQSETDDLPF